jgi:hypothetical protein
MPSTHGRPAGAVGRAARRPALAAAAAAAAGGRATLHAKLLLRGLRGRRAAAAHASVAVQHWRGCRNGCGSSSCRGGLLRTHRRGCTAALLLAARLPAACLLLFRLLLLLLWRGLLRGTGGLLLLSLGAWQGALGSAVLPALFLR